jgi:hypothetical protein
VGVGVIGLETKDAMVGFNGGVEFFLRG